MSQVAGSLGEADIEKQLSEWKAQMRAERNLRLTLPSAQHSLNASNAAASTATGREDDVMSAGRNANSNVANSRGRAALAAAASSGGRGTAATHRHADVATSLEDYKKQIQELAAPIAADVKLSRYRRASATEGGQNDETRSVVNPHDVTFHKAKSVVADYIRAPCAPASGGARQTGNAASRRSSSKSSRKRTVLASSQPRRREETSSRLNDRGRASRSERRTPRWGRSTNGPDSSSPSHTKESAALTTPRRGVHNDKPKVAMDVSGWTRAALLRREAAHRTLSRQGRADEGRGHRRSSGRTVSSPHRSREEGNANRTGGLRESPNRFRATAGPDPDAGRSAAVVQGKDGERERPVQMLFTSSLDHDRRARPAASTAAAKEPLVVARWQDPVTRSRFQPTIQYSSGRNPSPPARAMTSGGVNGVKEIYRPSWRDNGSTNRESTLPASDRLSVSPPTPSPLGPREQRRTCSVPRYREGDAEAHVPGAAVSARNAIPAPRSTNANTASPMDAWSSFLEPSFTRADLYQGQRAESARVPWADISADVTPNPRSVQPHPRPVWYREHH